MNRKIIGLAAVLLSATLLAGCSCAPSTADASGSEPSASPSSTAAAVSSSQVEEPNSQPPAVSSDQLAGTNWKLTQIQTAEGISITAEQIQTLGQSATMVFGTDGKVALNFNGMDITDGDNSVDYTVNGNSITFSGGARSLSGSLSGNTITMTASNLSDTYAGSVTLTWTQQ